MAIDTAGAVPSLDRRAGARPVAERATPAAEVRFVPPTYREVDEPVRVMPRDAGRLQSSWLPAWRRDRDGWPAYVTWSSWVGLSLVRWFAAGGVRAA